MNSDVMADKRARLVAGEKLVMSGAELDWLIDNELYPEDVVSIPNPGQVGVLDAYLVAHKEHPVMLVERQKHELMESVARSPMPRTKSVWDVPNGSVSARGWYWPAGSTVPGRTLCAGHYLDYGPGYRLDARQDSEPGTIHCVVIDKATGTAAAWRYVETVEQAQAWIEHEARKCGHF